MSYYLKFQYTDSPLPATHVGPLAKDEVVKYMNTNLSMRGTPFCILFSTVPDMYALDWERFASPGDKEFPDIIADRTSVFSFHVAAKKPLSGEYSLLKVYIWQDDVEY